MTTFYLVRHGSCDGLGKTIWGRTKGICLNEQGRAETQQLARRFADVKLDALYSSPLERARETADALARVAQLEIQQNDAFNEIDFGEWSGKSFEELARDERWQRFNSQRSMATIPGGESFIDSQTRAVNELEKLRQQHGEAHVAIVSHADVIKAVVGYVVGAPIDLQRRIEISPCSVSIVASDEHETKLLAVNSRSDLV
ncbi:MAG TPA: histidine phosphatase family protein [Pyrinomonadaceae bacterium]|nr:histidine phosphatase family protein [Pyrinomonadaceae bacterium]